MKDILANIFNRSLESGKYPYKFKMAKVMPIFKADDDSVPNNQSNQSLYYQVLIEFSKKNNVHKNEFIYR